MKASEGFGKLRKVAAFRKNLEKIWSKFLLVSKILAKFAKIYPANFWQN